MKIAVLSDVHGNYAALRMVLSDIARQEPDVIVNLGDIVSGPLQPNETAKLPIAKRLRAIAGKHERQALDLPDAQLGASDAYAKR
ncbi:MAG TPA: metallophosphoesterase [Candidatus Baltobacteraceae bacterium]|nr:metallophosphoesterase [Candidatus Baltobacteraceae bacterium]